MNKLHLSDMNHNKIVSEYTFETKEDMKEFVIHSKSEFGIVGMHQNGKNGVLVEFRDEDTKMAYDSILDEKTATQIGKIIKDRERYI